MGSIVLFGAGYFGRIAVEIIGSENVSFFIDNDIQKNRSSVSGITVFSYDEKKDQIKDCSIIICMSEDKCDEVKKQLNEIGVRNYNTIHEIRKEMIKTRLEKSKNNIEKYNNALNWIYRNTIFKKGILNYTGTVENKPYPEVTGYFIPSLISWGHIDLSKQYAEWLCDIQKPNGSWYDTDDEAPYVFDSAQILKGLIAVRELCPWVDDHIIRGCNWLLENIDDKGRLTTPTTKAWGPKGQCSELIHLYCLTPLRDASKIFGVIEYESAARKVLEYYKKTAYQDIIGFNIMSHFYAYIVEAMLDLGEVDIAKKAMETVGQYQKKSGAVPAYKNVDWVCSTAMFQYAMIWFRLGDLDRGNRAFKYACGLQNESGGWYGSYLSEENLNETNDYIPFGEISWANKFFLDALYAKNVTEFETIGNTFLDEIDHENGLYKTIAKSVSKTCENAYILDVGCGKGRYLNELIKDFPSKKYYAVDISEKVMQHIKSQDVIKKQGTLTCIPYPDNTFDFVYTCEALEHAIDIRSAIKEMIRVTKPGGTIKVIDKDKDKLGAIEIEVWEQWFDLNNLNSILSDYCSIVASPTRLKDYEGEEKGIFVCWEGKK